MNPDAIVTLLLGAGGAGGISGLVAVIRSWRKGKLEDEETLIKRLDKDNKEKDDRIDRLEARESKLRAQRNEAWDQAGRFRRQLVNLGADDDQNLEPLVKFDD